jgi:SAM-dependent methyltransferase
MGQHELYATPRHIENPDECDFYHAMDIPGYGPTRHPQWDLRGKEDLYLGGVGLSGKRVLEIGPASGFLTFYMESKGAEVVSVELAPDLDWDIVPVADLDMEWFVKVRREGIERTRNAYWFAHERFESSARVHYGNVYQLPGELGHFDIALMGSVLLHLRDPLKVMENCARLSDTLIVTDPHPGGAVPLDRPAAEFFSESGEVSPDIWWRLSPQMIVRFAAVMGFDHSEVTYHEQATLLGGERRPAQMFTVVARRSGSA